MTFTTGSRIRTIKGFRNSRIFFIHQDNHYLKQNRRRLHLSADVYWRYSVDFQFLVSVSEEHCQWESHIISRDQIDCSVDSCSECNPRLFPRDRDSHVHW
jgi:hypothetical protein